MAGSPGGNADGDHDRKPEAQQDKDEPVAPLLHLATLSRVRTLGIKATTTSVARGQDLLQVRGHDLKELMARIGLTARGTHRPAELSGGQQQRVAIGRALMNRPTIVFADEPTGNLDSKTSEEILTLMRESVDAYGQTAVMVTHDPRAAAIADRILFLDDGTIVNELGRVEAHDVITVMAVSLSGSSATTTAGDAAVTGQNTRGRRP